MFLYLVRHGEPDYKRDVLLPCDWEQAELAARRLAVDGIDEIHASPMGRAQQTAQPLSKRLGLPVITEPWARELTEATWTPYPDGRIKGLFRVEPAHFHDPAYRHMDTEDALSGLTGMCEGGYPQEYRERAEGLDGFLARCGYQRTEEGFYHAQAHTEKHIALFCHGAMTRVLLSHMLHIPVQYLASTLSVHFTGITILEFSEEWGRDIVPRMICCGDIGHLYTRGEPQTTFYVEGAPRRPF